MMAAAIAPIISGVASMAGAAMSASAMNSQAKSEEAMSRWNAERLREEAAWAQSKGASESERKGKEGKRKMATAIAAMAQGGVATDTGTPLLLQQEFASETAFNQNIEMANAQKKQADLNNRANITEYEGKIRADASRTQGRAALLSGFAGAVKGIGSAMSSFG